MLTAAEALVELANIKNEEQLRQLISQIDSTAPGSQTILYSGAQLAGLKAYEIAEAAADSDAAIRIVGNSEVGRFLRIDQNTDLREALTRIFESDPEQPGSRAYNFLNGTPIPPDGRAPNGIWDEVSTRFAAEAKGHVRLVTFDANPQLVFGASELKALLANPDVLSIEGIPADDLRQLVVKRDVEGLKAAFQRVTSSSFLSLALSGVTQETLPDGTTRVNLGDLLNSRLVDHATWIRERPQALELVNNFLPRLDEAQRNLLRESIVDVGAYRDGLRSVNGQLILTHIGHAMSLLDVGMMSYEATTALRNGQVQQAGDIVLEWSADAVGTRVGAAVGGFVGNVALAALAAGGAVATGPAALAVISAAMLTGGLFGGQAARDFYALAKDLDKNGVRNLRNRMQNVLSDGLPLLGGALAADLNGGQQYTIDATMGREEMVLQATRDIAWRYALRELNPFVIRTSDTTLAIPTAL